MMVQAYRWMSEAPRQRLGMAAFQRLLAMAILFRVSTEFNFAGFLWGPDSIGSFKFGNQLDSLFVTTRSTQSLLWVEGAAALALLCQRWTRFATVILWLTFSTLFFRTGEVSDGGDNLTYLALMFMIGLLPASAPGVAGSLRVWIHNLAVVAIVFQVCVVYFIAGISKAHGDAWNNGTALYLISQVEWFSLPASRTWFAHGGVATLGSYATMFFQIWFPIAMLSPLKPWFLVAAMGFHLGIAVNMGLITFSLVMAGADLSLITDQEYRSFSRRVRAMRQRVTAGWQVRWRAPATLYLDGDCSLCARVASIVRRLDVSRRLTVVSFRRDRLISTLRHRTRGTGGPHAPGGASNAGGRANGLRGGGGALLALAGAVAGDTDHRSGQGCRARAVSLCRRLPGADIGWDEPSPVPVPVTQGVARHEWYFSPEPVV